MEPHVPLPGAAPDSCHAAGHLPGNFRRSGRHGDAVTREISDFPDGIHPDEGRDGIAGFYERC